MVERITRAPGFFWSKWNEVNAKYGAFLLVICLMFSTLALIGIFIENKTNHAQSAQRVRDQLQQTKELTNLVICFDSAFDELTTGQPKVRAAATERNRAQRQWLVGDAKHIGLGEVIRQALVQAETGKKSKIKPLKELKSLAASVRNYELADDNLIKVQAENPYPASPARACDLNADLPTSGGIPRK